jgi:hypothetical protein
MVIFGVWVGWTHHVRAMRPAESESPAPPAPATPSEVHA